MALADAVRTGTVPPGCKLVALLREELANAHASTDSST